MRQGSSWRGQYITIPNLLSGFRLVLVPVLWVCAGLKLSRYIGLGLTVSFLTDYLDGLIARKFNMVTALGAKLDSLADDLMLMSVIAWAFMLRREIVTDHMFLVLAGDGGYGLTMLLSWWKFQQFGSNLHLYTHKASAVMGYLFLIHAFLFDGYHHGLFYLVIGVFILAQVETIGILLLRSELNEDFGSLLLLNRKRAQRKITS